MCDDVKHWVPHEGTEWRGWMPAYQSSDLGPRLMFRLNDAGRFATRAECAAVCEERNREQLERAVADVQRLEAELIRARRRLEGARLIMQSGQQIEREG